MTAVIFYVVNTNTEDEFCCMLLLMNESYGDDLIYWEKIYFIPHSELVV